MSVLIKSPPVFQGSSIEQVKQMYAYLYQMSEQINYALNALDSSNVADKKGNSIAVVGTASPSGESPEYSTDTYNELRALIQKTGTAVNESMASLKIEFGNSISEANSKIKANREELTAQGDVIFANLDAINENTSNISNNAASIQTNKQNIESITLSLENDYLLSSAFGSYKEEQKAALEASASGLVQSYHLDTVLSTADEVANFKTWQTTTDSYIKTGLLYYDEYGVGKYGVAIGENLSQVIIDGVVVKEQSNLLATFTANKLSFWMYGVEAAYFSNKTLYVTDAKINGSLEVANLLITKNEKGTIIRWVGD